jgi:hypothetical protein
VPRARQCNRAVKHPRGEPYAGKLHVRFCAGALSKAADLGKPGIDFRELKKRRSRSILFCPPDMMERYGRWLRTLISSALPGVMRVREPGAGMFERHPFFRDAKATIWERISSSGFAPSAPDVAMRRIISACLYAVTGP